MKQIVSSLLFVALSVVAHASDKKDAELAAQQYMTAFFNNDFETAASLMHPEALEDMKYSMLSELEKSKRAGREKEFYQSIGV